jgi:hypothetical protein
MLTSNCCWIFRSCGKVVFKLSLVSEDIHQGSEVYAKVVDLVSQYQWILMVKVDHLIVRLFNINITLRIIHAESTPVNPYPEGLINTTIF